MFVDTAQWMAGLVYYDNIDTQPRWRPERGWRMDRRCADGELCNIYQEGSCCIIFEAEAPESCSRPCGGLLRV